MSAADVDTSGDALPSRPQSTLQTLPPSSRPLDLLPPRLSSEDARPSPAPDSIHNQELAQSQPMTATPSTSSLNAAQESSDPSGPYGTRSRNRGPRPNYADDKELDLEIEATGRITKASSRKTAAAANASAADPAAPQAGFSAVNASASNDALAQQTSAQVSQPHAPAPSKKRKQPGSNAPVANASTPFTLGPRPKSAQPARYVETNIMSFSRGGAKLNAKKQLVADDGTTLAANDHAYLVCEPPGEPYYLARIMEFLHASSDAAAPVDAIRVNWYYRPKDIGRRVQDTRLVFASMHSDTCPIASLRGKCNIQHMSTIDNLDSYRARKDSFWFDKLYDRYMHRYYEVVPTSKVVNAPQRVKDVLSERWKFVLIEVGRGRDLTSASKKCVRCEQFAANHDSVDCAVCKSTYHMRCVRPPLQKKPARGFAWACAPCSRKQELRLEARNTPTLSESAQTAEDDLAEDEENDAVLTHQDTRESSVAPEPHPPPTAAQIAQANLWPWRYLGVHSRLEDALDYDDRIYPRASSRLGPRHQANVNVWHGRPVELVKPADIKKKYLKHAGSKKDGKMTKETIAAMEADKESRQKRPKWVLDEPLGYVPRGEDQMVEIKGKKEHTAQLIFKMPDPSKFTERGLDDHAQISAEMVVDAYMKKVKPIAAQYDLPDHSVDFLTKAIEKLQENRYDTDKALAAMRNLSRKTDLRLPDLNREEIRRFEEGVQKFGSELHAVSRHVGGNVKESRIVRYYYMWKKTPRGKEIWGNYEGRKSKKESKRLDKDGTGRVDDVADDADDSAFDVEKAASKKRGFECKFCATRSSRQWRRAPGTAAGTLVPRDQASKNSKDKSNWLTLALCGRCAYLWRRYAIQYESIEEISKKIAAAGGRASKRKIDEELLRTIFEAQYESGDMISMHLANEVHKSGFDVPQSIVQYEEPPKKKAKSEVAPAAPEVVPEKRKAVEKQPEAPLEPEPPRVKIHPCAVCHVIDVPGQELLKCRDCRLHVHGACYGVAPNANTRPWYCDMCKNDHNLQVSTIYECALCPHYHTPQDLMEPLKVSHKKKSDREREKERLEKEMVNEATRRWRQEQEAAGRPVNPREALKRTAWNNWVHITCALWIKEIRFGNAELLDDAEGIGFIPPERFKPACKVCKKSDSPTVTCHLPSCTNTVHVGCAHAGGYIFGFDVALVKGSRRDSVNVIKLDQETGLATPGIWCPNHAPSTYVHNMIELTESGLTALQLYARTYKQADTSITGTVRRAAQFTANVHGFAPAVQPPQRPATLVNGAAAGPGSQSERATRRSRNSPSVSPTHSVDDMDVDQSEVATCRPKLNENKKKCCSCLVETSPKWWKARPLTPVGSQTPPLSGLLPDAQSTHTQVHEISVQNASRESNGVPEREHQRAQPQYSVLTNGVLHVREEPNDTAVEADAVCTNEATMWQCHKCHVQEVPPPSSPSQVKPRQRPPPEPEPTYSPTYPHPPVMYPYPPPAMDGGHHSHPGPSPVAQHHSPWQNGPPQWSAPGMRNGPPPPPPSNRPVYGPPPPRYGSDFAAPYPPHPGPPGPYGVPPPPPNAGPQHSPPPGPHGVPPYQHPPPGHPPTGAPGRPPSPPRHGYEYPPPPAAGLGIAGPTTLGRPYAESGRPGVDSPVNGYGPPPPGGGSRFGPPPPSSSGRPGSTHAQSLAQIAQAASEHAAGAPPPQEHGRQVSGDNTPRMGPAGIPFTGGYPSPSVGTAGANGSGNRPVTPMEARSEDHRDRMGPGASASPSLRNLLS